MRALLLDPEAFLEERQRLGHDRHDEVWDGVVHVVPPASSFHQNFNFNLAVALKPLADARGWVIQPETMLFHPDEPERNFRVPDLTLVDPQYLEHRGIRGRAELAVEILSPNDESREKLPFYASREVQELWLVDREPRTVEIYALRDRRYVLVDDGRSPVLGVRVDTVAGPKLRIGTAEL